MEDMYVHQHAKVEPNRSTDGAVIGANVHTCSPLHKLYFTTNLCISILEYLSIYIALDLYIRVNENSLAYRHYISPFSFTLNALNYQLNYL